MRQTPQDQALSGGGILDRFAPIDGSNGAYGQSMGRMEYFWEDQPVIQSDTFLSITAEARQSEYEAEAHFRDTEINGVGLNYGVPRGQYSMSYGTESDPTAQEEQYVDFSVTEGNGSLMSQSIQEQALEGGGSIDQMLPVDGSWEKDSVQQFYEDLHDEANLVQEERERTEAQIEANREALEPSH